MKWSSERIRHPVETPSGFLSQEQRAADEMLSSILQSLRAVQGSTSDRRLQHVAVQLKDLQRRGAFLAELSCRDYLAKISKELNALEAGLDDSRIGTVLRALVQLKSHSLSEFCEVLLDGVIQATGAERGFLLLYHPESTESEIVSARNFQTYNLSVEDSGFSPSMLAETLRSGESLLVKNASDDSRYSKELSVVVLNLKSVLVAPLRRGERTIGAIYLDNRSLASAFDDEDRRLLDVVSAYASSFLHYTRLLPAPFRGDRRIFLDETKASTEILGRDPRILDLVRVIQKITDSDAAVLIQGESGTGKELVARALHAQSRRRDRRFVAINCPAIPESLLESELFGHEKGAYTGATEQSAGHIQEADGGTLLLDEVAELPYSMQAKLLRFLQSQEFRRLGGKEIIRVDVRVVAATSKDLNALISDGKL